MAAVSVLSLTACGGGDRPEVTISVINFDGGVGSTWLEDAVGRFQTKMETKVYPNGKTGVYVDWKPDMNVSTAAMATSGYNIYFVEGQVNVYTYAQERKLACVNDIMEYTAEGESRTIGDKVEDGFKTMLKGEDGNYYALPHYEWMPGMSYDLDLFESGKYFFAKPNATSPRSPKDKTYGDIKFANDLTEKSCGPDGEYGTTDDGLPSSLQELFVLCSELKSTGCTPIVLAGGHKAYSSYLVEGLWASLSGFENARANFTFSSDAFDVVDGYKKDAQLFQGVNGIEEPIVKTIEMTESEANLTYDAAARYYATAAVKTLTDKGWITTFSPNLSHTGAQEKFIFGGSGANPKIGMIIEGSYWWNESDIYGTFDLYKESYPNKPDRRFRFMSLPTQVNGSVTEGNGKAPAFFDCGNSYCLLNANIDDKSVMEACKDFLKFLYSDEELRLFTLSTGCARNLKYDLTDAQKLTLNDYRSHLWNLRGLYGANVVYAGAQNDTFLENRNKLRMELINSVFTPKIGEATYDNYYSAFTTDATITARDIFEITKKSR
jgi:hypothetical protein